MSHQIWKIIDYQVPINPYGKAKKMAEDMILDFSKNSDMAVMILRSLIFLEALRKVSDSNFINQTMSDNLYDLPQIL